MFIINVLNIIIIIYMYYKIQDRIKNKKEQIIIIIIIKTTQYGQTH